MRAVLLVAALAALAGCSSPHITWSKPGSGQAEFDRDAAMCRNQARMVLATSSNPYIRFDDIAVDCMRAQGWTGVQD